MEQKKSLRELRNEEIQQARQKDLAFWSNEKNLKEFIERLELNLDIERGVILKNLDSSQTIFQCNISISIDPSLSSFHAEGYILTYDLREKIEMALIKWCHSNDVYISTIKIVGKNSRLSFYFTVDLSQPYQFETPIIIAHQGCGFVPYPQPPSVLKYGVRYHFQTFH